MPRRVKQSKVYIIEILQMPVCREEASKVKSTELKYWGRKYPQTKKAK